MRIAQIVLPGASQYELKCQRIDATAFEIAASEQDADLVHVYGRSCGVRRPRRRLWNRPSLTPLSPLRDVAAFVPEAVEEVYFAPTPPAGNVVGVYLRPSIAEVLERTRARVARTRDDVEWRLFDRVPAPGDLAGITVWLDPAMNESDFDGFVAEALAMGRLVVASRTPINAQRLEKGRSGFLAPAGDANELTHAILAALFKPEFGGPRSDAARQTISKFRPRQRARALMQLYERLRS